ncbi:MAG TPA: 3-hydroxyacyl-CoA dehydrogenase family protein [Anaerovoracaceae bacterium]|nr:3-hydroxyacyl-CoA dehydrogenase family protein [Anaerovoracaceae bacterium]
MSIEKVGVIGAGMMGAEIALCFARAGYEVVMADITEEIAAKGKEKQVGILDKSIAKGKFDAAKKDEVLNKVTATADYNKMADCDFIVEAVLEVLEVKHDTYAKLDAVCKPGCIFASNTSSISITKLASAVSGERVGKFIGTHFNSPASIMKLVEVIPALLTSEETIAATMEVLYSIEKEPVKVKDVVGFALNRLFHVFCMEACRLIEEEVCSIEDVDKICVYGLGHPAGVFRLLDMMGHDLNIKVDKIMFDAYGERFRPSQYMQKLVDAGHLGKKTGQGFYKY